MPEGPEVLHTTKGLKKLLIGDVLRDFSIINGRYHGKGIPGSENLSKHLPGIVFDIQCKGKFIWIEFKDRSENSFFLWNTLGMTGRWDIGLKKHSRVVFEFEKNGLVYFSDMRNFGTLKWSFSEYELQTKLKSLGPDLMNEEISFETAKNIFGLKRNSYKTICEVIMSQKNFAGVGNYLKAEILYRLKISPWRICSELTDQEIKDFIHVSKELMWSSYLSGGATISNYADLYNQIGRFEFQVYGKDRDPNGKIVIRENTPDKRTTHWVLEVQK